MVLYPNNPYLSTSEVHQIQEYIPRILNCSSHQDRNKLARPDWPPTAVHYSTAAQFFPATGEPLSGVRTERSERQDANIVAHPHVINFSPKGKRNLRDGFVEFPVSPAASLQRGRLGAFHPPASSPPVWQTSNCPGMPRRFANLCRFRCNG